MAELDGPPKDFRSQAEVVSCKFLRYNCDHPVFQKEYTRSNRKAGTKILRCFPHCCPEHATRCYCGCSIHILVTFKDASIVNDREILVCARFEAPSSSPEYQPGVANEEPTATRKLAHGELVVLPPEVLQAMPHDSVESLWIRAYREGESKQQSVPENSVLYVMNNYRFPKWYYGYESGATKSQREMKHYLRAYVLRLERPRDRHPMVNWGGSWIASVVARHSSPGFTLISYRRASCRTIASMRVGTEEAHSGTESDREDRDASSHTALPSQSASQARVVQDSHLFNLRDDHDDAGGILLGLRYAEHRERSNPFDDDETTMKPDPQSPSHQSFDRTRQLKPRLPRELDEKLFWCQPKYVRTVERARELSVVQYFITHVAVDEVWSSIAGLENRLRESWIKSIYNNTRDQRSLELLSGFCAPTTNSHLQQHRCHEGLLAVHPVLALCAEVSVEFATSTALQALVWSTLQIDFAADTPESRKLETRRQFAMLADGVHSHLDAFLADKKVRSVTDLVDELVTLVNQNQRLRWMQTAICELFERATPDRCAFEAFSAQSREMLMASGTPYRRPRTSNSSNSASGDGLSRWNRRWLLNSRSLHIGHLRHASGNSRVQSRTATDGSAFQFSAWELLSTIQQFGAIDMAIDDGSAALRMSSVFGSSQALGQPMHLTLDGKYRVFRTFPNGVSTMAVARDGWVYGDYF
ncbi:hypothetical protein Gpo141_00014129, partial [Globisporangium polare]